MKHILFLLIAGLLLTAPEDCYAQKKTSSSTSTKAKTSAVKPKTSTTKSKSPTTKSKSPTTKTTTKPKTTTTKAKPMSRAEYEKQQKDLQKRIKETEKMISDNDQSVKTQSRDIKLREQEIGHRKDLLVAMNQEIEAIAYEEDSLKDLIIDLQGSIAARKEKYGQAMRHMYKKRDGYEEILFVLTANSLVESLRRMRYLRQYSDWRKQEAIEIEEQRRATETAKEELTKTREERQIVLNNIDNERIALTKKQQQQEAALANLKKRGKELQAELEKDQKQQAEVQRKIQQMIDEERRKAEEARKKAEAEAKKKANSGKNTPSQTTKTQGSGSSSTASKTTPAPTKSGSSTTTKTATTATAKTNAPTPASNLTGSFRQNKGKLPYPVDSSYAYLRHYKEKNDGNVSISLSTAVGANAISVFEGKVLRCSRSSDDYTVIISHGDYMSVYSNLSSVSVKEGQTVKGRTPIGKVKSDVNGRRGELMFWIYGKSDAENPETWLKR